MKILLLVLLLCAAIWATVYGSLRGIVHDPDHRPVPGASVTLKSVDSDYSMKLTTNDDGKFETASVPAGAYQVSVTRDGFAPAAQSVVVVSGSAPVLHFQLAIGASREVVTVSEAALVANPEVITPTTIVSRKEIQMTPGANLSNSLALITNYVPGAWVTHDQLHVRGGHQVTWAHRRHPDPEYQHCEQRRAADRSKGYRLPGSAARRLFVRVWRSDLWGVQCRAEDGL